MMLIEKVRASTSMLHQALDNAMMPYIHALQSKEDYAAFLRSFYGFFKPVYDSIDKHLHIYDLLDYQSRRKPDWILNDLKALEADDAIELCHHLPAIYNNATAFGALYVLEGSTLGGTVIRKMVLNQINIEDGLSFFNGYGKQTRVRWNVFIQALNSIETHNAVAEMVIQTAASTFTLFGNWLQQKIQPVINVSG